MYGSMERMFWKYFFVFFSLIVCIYCENWLNDDEVQSNREAQYDHQINNQNSNQNHHVKSESRRLNGHYQHSFHNEAEIPLKHFQALSDDPVANGDSSLPFNVAAVDRKYVRRMNFRRRKISSSNHKKNIFRRGQRHRQNKNGNSLPFRDNKSISLRVFFFILSAHYTIKAITNRFNLCTPNEFVCPFLSTIHSPLYISMVHCDGLKSHDFDAVLIFAWKKIHSSE